MAKLVGVEEVEEEEAEEAELLVGFLGISRLSFDRSMNRSP
jgi:hypothetical protein